MDALFIVDVSTATANKGSYVNAIAEFIQYRVDELDMISFDKQTDLNLNHALFGRSAIIVDDAVFFNLDDFPIFDKFDISGSNHVRISLVDRNLNAISNVIGSKSQYPISNMQYAISLHSF